MKTLAEYIEDGRYTIVASSMGAAQGIKHLYPTAVVTTSDADGIGGKKLLVDKWAADGLGLKSALPKYRKGDVVYENFTKQFVEGGNVTVNFSSKGYERWEQAVNQMTKANEELQVKLCQAIDNVLINGDSKQQPIGILNESRHDASAWIQDTIDKLKSFKQRVDDGHVIIMDGDYSVAYPAPDREQATYDCIHCQSISWKQNPEIGPNKKSKW